ncbi:PPE family protein [Candidatus Mycobacterium methanotrophicum]|uniref:PPE family protein n=1 Tax=Candidatus Mycobacterium methanotrophicum TaxID=2943498 RepID=A0ABY4QJA1_9MYCO|nr:PPE family protein [Candidatus Mycobacterium methanotrophicum]UQX09760.1 PPE family protein [Candidatus Mycobacterium methanotrophicum]
MDFGLLPPEINSGRMYTGPGSAPMLAAAAGWDDLSADLHATAASYDSVISALTARWQGPSAATMAAAAAPFVAWLRATGTQAEQTATQARVAAAAYETAFAATVPPPAIAANRAMLASLIATNLFGQNTAAIAATEADYAEMWAQDALAMYGYASSSSAAAQLRPFRPPPRTTNPTGAAAQPAAVAQATGTHAPAAPQVLQTLSAPASTAAASTAADPPSLSTPLTLISYAVGGFNPVRMFDPFGAFYDQGIQTFLAPFNNFNMQNAYSGALSRAAAAAGGVGPGLHTMNSAGGAVSAGIGRAGLVGGMSAPPGWAGAAPAIRPVALVLPGNNLAAVPAALAGDSSGSVFSNMALSGLAGRAVAGTGTTVAPGVGGTGGVVPGAATTATIIVIPED